MTRIFLFEFDRGADVEKFGGLEFDAGRHCLDPNLIDLGAFAKSGGLFCRCWIGDLRTAGFSACGGLA
jgi:hypothetical protein